MWLRRQPRWATALLVLVVGAAACQAGEGRGEAGPVEAWRVTSIDPIGQPVAAGDVVVVYGTVERELRLYGVDAGTGAVRWSQAASPGAGVNGISLTPAVLGGRVVYFRPDPAGNLMARLVVASPADGRDELVSEPAEFDSRPARCPDGRDICVAVSEAGRPPTPRRFQVEAGTHSPGSDHPRGSRVVGEELLDLGGRAPERLARFTDGSVRWVTELANHFPPGFSTDHGWTFELYEAAGVYVGSVSHPPVRNTPSMIQTDLSRNHTAAIDAGTGASVWQSEGTRFGCSPTLIVQREVAARRFEAWPVRCRARGTARYDKPTSTTAFENLDVTIEGFDPRTGATTWTVPLGPAEAFLDEDERAAVVDASRVLVRAADGPLVVDLENGASRVPEPTEMFWCVTEVIFQYRETLTLGSGRTSNQWRGGELVSPCTGDGSPTDRLPRRLPYGHGATVGDHTVVATVGGLIGYTSPQ